MRLNHGKKTCVFRAVLGCMWGAACVAGVPQVCAASVVVQLDGTQMAALSDVIVHGTVLRSQPVAFSDGRIMTAHVMQVSRWIRQDAETGASETFVFYTRGGQIGDRVTRVTGEAHVEPSDEVVVFLAARSSDVDGVQERRYFCVGMAQGAFVVLTDENEKRVVRSDERIKRRAARMRRARASLKDVAEPEDRALGSFLEAVEKNVAEGLSRDAVLNGLPFGRTAP